MANQQEDQRGMFMLQVATFTFTRDSITDFELLPCDLPCEAILHVVRWPRGAGSCLQLVNAPWGSRCKAALNMFVDVASTM